MKALNLLFTYFVFLGFIYIMYIAFFEPRVLDSPFGYKTPSIFYDYKGVTHIHSERSSGSGSIEKIAEAANNAQLDFIYITDLNPFEFQNLNEEGIYGRLLLFSAGEYSYLDAKVLNYHNSTFEHLQSSGRIQLGFSDLLDSPDRSEKFGLFILSHPFKPGYRWNGDIPVGFDGIEIINLKSLWQQWFEKSKASFIFTLALYPFNSRLALIRLLERPRKNLKLWDSLNSKDRYSIGMVGNDAEALAKLFNNYAIELPSYENMFGMATNHVLLKSELTGDFQSDKKKIQTALSLGQFYLSFDFIANPRGFSAFVQTDGRKELAMGKDLDLAAPSELVIQLPEKLIAPVKVTLIKDGEVFMSSDSVVTKVNLTVPGTYRIEVQVRVPLPFP
ncbi:MAG: hypothetical protein R2827_16710 [Bdellovibrionales bacterium]